MKNEKERLFLLTKLLLENVKKHFENNTLEASRQSLTGVSTLCSGLPTQSTPAPCDHKSVPRVGTWRVEVFGYFYSRFTVGKHVSIFFSLCKGIVSFLVSKQFADMVFGRLNAGG